ncbi:MAG: pyrroloquinoline quinone-dependent dehydrogenase [Gammaproteobacteria bacterium]
MKIFATGALCGALLSMAAATPAADPASSPVTAERLAAGTGDTSGWVMYGGNYENTRFSPLDDVNRDNVKGLTPAWLFQTGIPGQLAGAPIVVDGVVYLTASYNNLFALDAASGAPLWHYEHQMPSDLRICCGPVNRGVAVAGEHLFMATLDARLIAFERTSGKIVWNVAMDDHKAGYSATSAPVVIGDLVISGIAGGEYGARGFVDAYDIKSGERRWRVWTVPAAGEPGVETWAGDSWKTGGGPSWVAGTYDAKSGLLFWPTGNPSPDWNGDSRLGDNLYTNSVLAIEPKTGKLAWHFQYTPHDVWDYDATNNLVVADIDLDGQSRHVVLQPNRNGYVYVLDAATGEFLKGAQYTDRVNWATGLDAKGRPILNPGYEPVPGGHKEFVCPGNVGGNNGSFTWAWSPATRLMYVPSIESCAKMVKEEIVFVHGQPFWGGGPGVTEGETGEAYGRLVAIDPATGETAWKYRDDYPMVGGALATAGGLVFAGNQQGYALAFDDKSGDILWKFQTGSAVRGQPVTWKQDGRQYVAYTSGGGGLAVTIVGEPPITTLGSTLVVFALPR